VDQLDPRLVIDECRRLHEAGVRSKRAFLSVGARAAAKLDHGIYADMLGRQHDALFLDGRVTWAAIVMANTGLFQPSKRDLPAGVIYSLEGAFDDDPSTLRRIAERIYHLKDKNPSDARLVPLARAVTDETARETNVVVPPHVARGHPLRYETLYIQRHRLPARYLADQVLPVIVHPQRPTHVMVLPLEYWSPAIVARWHEIARTYPPVQEPPPLPTDDALRAFARNPLTLTPAALRAVRDIVARERFGTEVKLRVEVDNGAYGLDLTEEDVNPDTDLLYDHQGLAVVVDQTSAVQLTGVQIDFKTTANGNGFVFNKRS
jgi:Fe-S cluster assembly iron-binding protein IscA